MLGMGTQPPVEVIAAAQAAEHVWNVPASVTLAQWALESGWGQHMPPGSNNPFGIKALPGQPFVGALTREFENGKWISIGQSFRKFDTLADAFDAHAQLLATSGRYAAAREYDFAPDRFAQALTGIYATDPHYGGLLHAIMQSSNLYQYDRPHAAQVIA